MHSKKWCILFAMVAAMLLLLSQGVALAAPVTGTTGETTASSAPTEETAGTTGGETTGATDTGETTETTTAPTAAVEREPVILYRPLIRDDTGFDKTATWYDGGVTTEAMLARWDEGHGDGKALLFADASNYMRVDIDGMATPFTLSFWVNRQEEEEVIADQRLFTINGENPENEIFLAASARRVEGDEETVVADGLLLSVSAQNKETTQRQEVYHPANATVSNGLPIGRWHHVALTVEETALSVYIDGVLWKQTALTVPFKDISVKTLQLGGSVNRSLAFSGRMEDARLYAGALSATQIARLAKDADPFDPTVVVTQAVYAPETLPDVLVSQRTFRARSDGDGLVLSATPQAFWEAPQIGAGQTVTGILTVQSHGRYPVDMTLQKIVLPKAGTPEFEYLSKLDITVAFEGKVLYSGPYTALTAEALAIAHTGMTYGAEHRYTISLFCPFDHTEKAAATVEWDFDSQYSDGMAPPPAESQPVVLLIVLTVSAAALILCIFWAAKRNQK